MINVDAYLFLAFSNLTCHLQDTGIGFSRCTAPPDSKETKIGSSNQEVSLSAGITTGIVLVPCRARKCDPTAISGGVDVSEVPGCHLF